MTHDAWLAQHPFLRPAADLHAIVDSIASEISIPAARVPPFDRYADDYRAGVPLLRSSSSAIDLPEADDAIEKLFAAVTRARVDARDDLRRHLEWVVLVRYLAPIVDAFGAWRDEELWLRNYCPTCGTPPAMGQLIGIDPGRLRLLSCGCCKTRWRYRRTGCPFCENRDDHRLAIVAVEGEAGLRIDYCESCRGYLKTYDGQGNESILLADWTSLHLDVLACDRGLKRLAASLYAF